VGSAASGLEPGPTGLKVDGNALRLRFYDALERGLLGVEQRLAQNLGAGFGHL
jgi:hypothetical protein